MNFINFVDNALIALESADRFTRDSLSILCWLIGRVVDILSSRRALRVYATIARLVVAFVCGFITACRWAYESGQIVAAGYYGTQSAPLADTANESEGLALPCTTIAGLLPAAPEPESRVIITPAPVSFPQLAIDNVHPIIPVFLDRNGNPLKGNVYKQRLKKVHAAV